MKYVFIFSVLLFRSGGWLVIGEDSPRCRFQEFRCQDGSACLLSEKLCNGVEDCPEGEDERGSEQWDCTRTLLNTDCGDQHQFFKCRFGGCVPRRSVCDGKLDCWGGTDESTNLCGETGLRPAPNRIPPSTSNPKPHKPIVPTNTRPINQPPPPNPEHPIPRPAKPRPPAPPVLIPVEVTQRPQIIRPIPTSAPEVSRPRPPRPPPPTVESPEPIQPNALTCNPIDPEEGVRVKCEFNKRPVACSTRPVNGTIAYFTCKDHYSTTQNAPRMTRRMCRNGEWSRRNRKWNCNLECGVGGRDAAQFIVGGYTSAIGKWPWHVGFYREDPPGSDKLEYFCGGTMISARTVLTAAHCVTTRDGGNIAGLKLFFGKYYRDASRNDEWVQVRQVAEVNVNEYYSVQTYVSDIALVVVDQPLEITDRVRPACLPNEVDIESGDWGTLVGWGRYSDRSYPEELQEASLPVITFKNCQKAHPSLEALVKADTFCAGHRNGTSPCDGDSGSGLVSQDSTGSRWSVYGIVSAGVAKRGGGCDPKYYTVFTRVFKFRNWIDMSLDTPFRRKRSLLRQSDAN